MATFRLLLLPSVFATMIYIGLGGLLCDVPVRLKQTIVAVLGIWCLTQGYIVAGLAMLAFGADSDVAVIEYFVHALRRSLWNADVWTHAISFVGAALLNVLAVNGGS